MVAALCARPVVVENLLVSEDIIATAHALISLGADIRYDKETRSLRVRGFSRPFENMVPGSSTPPIFVNQSGTTLRFLLPGLSFARGTVRVKGKLSLKQRPNAMIVEPLRQLGVDTRGKAPAYTVPLEVKGEGFLPAGDVLIRGSQSSQVVSAFLLWLPLASSPRTLRNAINRFIAPKRLVNSHIRVEGSLVSKPYVDITIDALRRWGGIVINEVEPGRHYSVPSGQQFRAMSDTFRVGGDYSSAAFILAAATLCNANVLVKGLQRDEQGDRQIVPILVQMGANITETDEGIRVKGPASLTGIELDCASIPDLVPILSVLGTFARGRTVLRNISHLKHKESDRLVAPTEELRKLGANISCTEDSITIEQSELSSAKVSARHDHRLAMSLIVAGLASRGVEVDGAGCIVKSYPTFLIDMLHLGADIKPVA
jgi:3-phosphoshikimate 1-carboxyvinyltransferase